MHYRLFHCPPPQCRAPPSRRLHLCHPRPFHQMMPTPPCRSGLAGPRRSCTRATHSPLRGARPRPHEDDTQSRRMFAAREFSRASGARLASCRRQAAAARRELAEPPSGPPPRFRAASCALQAPPRLPSSPGVRHRRPSRSRLCLRPGAAHPNIHEPRLGGAKSSAEHPPSSVRRAS